MVYGATFNSGVRTLGVTVTHTRAWATVDAVGRTVPANTPNYGDRGLFVAPPTGILTVDDTNGSEVHAIYGSGAEWSDGSPALIQTRSTGGTVAYYVNIHVGTNIAANCFKTLPSRSVDIRWTASDATYNPSNRKSNAIDISKGLTSAEGASADWVYEPITFLLERGCALALCQAKEWTGSAFETRAISLFWWDDSSLLTNKWTQLIRTVNAQDGQGRLAPWAMPRAYQFSSDPLTRWVPFVDYRGNTGSTGGEVWLLKLTRTSESAGFTPGVCAPVFEIPHADNLTGTHVHGASVWEMSDGGLGMIVDWGDGSKAFSMILTRTDKDYLEGHPLDETDTQPVAVTFLAPHIVPGSNTPQTSNGWTLYPHVTGDPDAAGHAITFTNATWTQATKVLSDAELTIGSNQGNLTGRIVVATSGTGVVNPTLAIVSSHSTTNLTLDRDIAPSDAANIGGFVARGITGPQPVARETRYGDEGVIFYGTDEGTNAVYKATMPTFVDGDIHPVYERVTSRVAASNYGLYPDVDGTTNVFLSAGPGADKSGPFAFVSGSSAAWTETEFSRVLYGPPAMDAMGSMYAPNFNNNNVDRIVWYISPDTGRRYLIMGRAASNSLIAIPEPAYTYSSPMVSGQNAFTQELVTPTVDRGAGLTGNSTYTVKTRAELATLVTGRGPIPEPPAQGEIGLVDARSSWSFMRQITGTSVSGGDKLRIKFWVYPLPPANPPSADGVLPYAGPMAQEWSVWNALNIFGFKRRIGMGGTYNIEPGGWFPVTLELDEPSTWDGTGASAFDSGTDYAFAVAGRWQNGEVWRPMSYLICWDSVVSGDVDIPVLPMPVGAAAQSVAAARTTIMAPEVVGDEWTLFARFRVPFHGSDQWTTNRPTTRSVFTLTHAAEDEYLTLRLDPTNNAVMVENGVDGLNDVSVAAPGAQLFSFDRGSVVTVAMVHDGAALTLYASVDGTVVNSAFEAVDPLAWDRIRAGNVVGDGEMEGVEIQSLAWFPTEAMTSDQVEAKFEEEWFGVSGSAPMRGRNRGRSR